MKTIDITLSGRPISVNHLYRSDISKKSGKPFTYMTTEGSNAKLAWSLEARSQMKRQFGEMLLTDDLEVFVDLFFENKLRRDIDNYLKAVLDCLSGVLWADDRQIATLHVYRRLDPGKPRTEIRVRASEN